MSQRPTTAIALAGRGRRMARTTRRRLGNTLKVLDGRSPAAVRRTARQLARNLASERVGRALVTIVLTAGDDDLEYLDAAVRSAVDQTHPSLEILVLGYGDTERLPAALKGWLAADHRVRLVRGSSPTLAAARDRGARLAKGRLLCFLRGHDTLPPRAVAEAFDALHRSGSDFVIGRMTSPPSLLPSVLPRRDVVHDSERLHTTLADFPAAITEMSLGNRMFATGFWRRARLSFGGAEGETQLVLQGFEKASSFDVITASTYTERSRGDALPVEQMYDSTADLSDWLTDTSAVGQRLRRLGDRLYETWLVGVCENQVQTFLGDVERISADHWRQLRDGIITLRDGVEEQVWNRLRAEPRVKLELLINDQRTLLEEFVAARWFERDNVATTIESGRIYARLPYFDQPATDGPGQVVDREAYVLAESETPARAHLRSVRSGPGDQLELDLLVRIELVDLAGREPTITARLVPDGEVDAGDSPEPIELPVRSRFDDQANLTVSHRYQDYRTGGCTVTIDRAALQRGTWHLETTVEVDGVTRSTAEITVDRRGSAFLLGTRYGPVHNTRSATAVTVAERQRRLIVQVSDCEPIGLTAVSVRDRSARLTVAPRPGSLPGVAVTAVTARCGSVRAQAAVTDSVAELVLPEHPVGSSPIWQLRAIGSDRVSYPIAWPGSAHALEDGQSDDRASDRRDPGPWLAEGEGELVAARSEWGNAMLVEASQVVLLDAVELRPRAVRVRGHWTGATSPQDLEIVVKGPRHQTSHPIGSADFSFDVPLYWDPWGLGEVGVPRGEYRLTVQRAGEGADENGGPDGVDPSSDGSTAPRPPAPARVWASPEWVGALSEFQFNDVVRLGRLLRRGGTIGFTLAAPIPLEHAGAYQQQRLQQACLDGLGPIDQRLAYFASYDGSQPTDSGVAIQEELLRSRPGVRAVWGVADLRTPVPDGAEKVLINSAEWYRVLSTAGHLVQNVDFPRWWRKRPGQQFLQTFHGYPAKSMGLRMWRAKEFTPRRLQAELERTMAGWDLILTPAPEMDRYYREEYAYRGPIHNQGYPRDDALVLPSARQRREFVRDLLGIRADQKAILYAPTWRDHLASSYQSAAMVDNLDVASASAELGDDYVLLLRGHRFTSKARRVERRTTRIIDLTEYPEINDLIVAADAAVLDYSSLRFDFALTGRPMVFLVPDLADYTGGVRGFLYDFTDTAPGPLAETADEVITALRDLDGLAARYRDQLEAFNAKYQYLQDGHAAQRVVQRFFGESGE